MSSSRYRAWRKLVVSGALLGLVLVCLATDIAPAHAATGINQQLNFQGRLLNTSGATVSDGVYNVEFKIYQDGDGQSVGDTTGSPAGSLKWTEDHLVSTSTGVTVRNGYLSVQLGSVTAFGSSINWNQDTLWLSVNIGNTASCTITTSFNSNCGGDGEMTPMKRLSSSPYALNSNELGGLTSTQYVQLAQGLQTEAGNSTNSIYINKTGTGGNFIDLQAGGTDAFILNNSGNVTFGNNGDHTISVTTASAGAAGKSLTISAGTAGSGASALAGGNLVLQGGTGGGTNGNGGNITIDAGAPNGTGSGGSVNIGTTNAAAVDIATNAAAHTIEVGDGAGVQTITIGSVNSTSSLLVQAGTGNLSIQTQGGTLGIGNNAVAQTLTIGNTTGATSITLQSGSGGISLNSATSVAANLTVTSAGNVAFQKGSDFATTGATNNASLGAGTLIRLTGTSTQTITGIAGGANGRLLTIVNAAGQAAIISNLNAGSTGANQIATGTGSDLSLASGASIDLVYDSGSSVWRVVGSTGSTTGFVQLQGSSPGTFQTGNINVNGSVLGSVFDVDPAVGTTLSIGTATTTTTIQIGSTTLNSGTQTINIGTNNVVGGTTNVTIGSGSASTAGTTTLRGKSGITLSTNGITRGTYGTNNDFYYGNGTSSASPNNFTVQSTASSATGVAGGSLTIQGGNATVGNANGGNITIDAGALVGAGSGGTVNIGTSNASTIQIGSTTLSSGTQTINLGTNNVAGSTTNVTIGSGSASTAGATTVRAKDSITFAVNGITRGYFDNANNVYFGNGASNAAPNNFTLQGTASTTTAVAGGTLTIQGGNATVGTAGGGGVTIDAGAAIGGATGGSISIGTTNASSITVGSSSQAGTVVLQQSGISQTITGSATAPTDVIKTTTNNSGAFQVQNSSSNRVLGVDTSANQVLLGQSSALNGTLVFRNSSNSNSVTLNSTAANANYTLTLPSSAPSTGLCIETSSGSASQLVFASCSNNNTSISEVQEWDANNTNTVTVSPSTIGDEMVLTTQIPTGSVTVSSISGGGVTTWSKIIANNGNGTVHRVEMWAGTVTSTGSSSITVTYSSSPGAEEITATEFTAAGVNSSTSWGVESSAAQLNSTSSTTVTYPSATAVNGSELYIGYAQVQNPPATSGSSSGFSYIITSTQHNVITYDTGLAANTSYQPTANQNSAGQSNTVDAVLTAFVTSTSINNTTSLQKANFYVQAASGGSVAGVLQAASTGTADILDLRNSGSSNVVSVNSAGNLLVNPATSTTAFQVQNGSSSVLTVDTSNNKVILGTSSALAGALSFNDSSDSNSITLAAPTSVATSYTLTLPNNTPTAGLCLGTSPSNATQLIFASCATQVSAASISYVNKWDNHGTSVTTISDSPANIGNLLVFYSHAANAVTISSISGGGVGSWTKVTAYSGGGTPGNIEMWRGVVTTTGAGTITVTYSSAAGTNEIVAQEFSMGSANGTWAIDTSGTATTTSTVTTVNYPSLTPLNSSELYTGYAYGGGTMSSGTTTGFTYVATGASKYLAYDTNVTGGIAYAPTAPQTSGVYASVAAVIAAYSGTSVIVDSTATQEANFNVQAATSGTVAGVLQAASSGTADIFQAKNSSGDNITAINASNGLTLGTASTVGGQLNFAASGNGNSISIVAPSTPGSSYTLTLPTTTPAAGQCLATSPNNANQLVFSSCANQVTSVAITFVNNWKTNGNAVSTLSVSPTNIGDLMVFFASPNSAASVATVSGGGVSTWTKVTGTTSGSGSATSAIEMWRGQVTSTGSSTITVTYNNPAGNPAELAASEFTTGSSSGSWVVDASNAQYNSSSSTTVAYPSLTPQSTKDLYVGYASTGSTMSAGSTTGFTYLAGSLTSREGAYNTSVSASVSPTATQSVAGTSVTVGALIAAYSSSSVISNSTVTQEANFNIQAATTGSVAGVLQAAQSGTADVMDILNSAGTIVDSFSSTGNLLVQPSTASANALRVQTTGNANVLSVDTSGLKVVIGAGATGEATPSLLVVDSETGTSSDPSGVNGSMYYNATTHTLRCYVDGAWQTCTGLLYSNTSNSSANNNCTTNCNAFSTFASIPANYCQTGRVFALAATGYFSSTGSPNLQFGVYYGTSSSSAASDTLIGTVTPAVTVTSASNNYFQVKDTIICFSTSSMQSGGTATIQTGSNTMSTVPMTSTSGTAVSTSSTNNLYLFPIWDTASTSNTATVTQMTVNAY